MYSDVHTSPCKRLRETRAGGQREAGGKSHATSYREICTAEYVNLRTSSGENSGRKEEGKATKKASEMMRLRKSEADRLSPLFEGREGGNIVTLPPDLCPDLGCVNVANHRSTQCGISTLFLWSFIPASLCLPQFQEVKTKSLLAMERAREEGAAKEALLTASMANNKQKLLTDLAQEEAAREEQVRGLQQLKDREREGLFESLAQGKFRQ